MPTIPYQFASLVPLSAALAWYPRRNSSDSANGSIGLKVPTVDHATRPVFFVPTGSSPAIMLLAMVILSVGVIVTPPRNDGVWLLSLGLSQPVTSPPDNPTILCTG